MKNQKLIWLLFNGFFLKRESDARYAMKAAHAEQTKLTLSLFFILIPD